MLKLSTLFLLFVFPAQQPPPGDLPSAAEFPPQDQLIWSMERQGLLAKLAARRLNEAPDSPGTVRLLADARNFDGMLAALRVIVDAHPRRIAEGFDALREAAWQFRGDDEATRRNRETLRQIVADARRRLPDLPLEEAARAERVFVNLDGEFSGQVNGEWAKRIAGYVERYRGTEAALLAEVDVIGSGRVSARMFEALDAFIEAHPGTTAAAKALHLKGFHWHTINTLGVLEPRGADPSERFMRVLAIVNELESGRYPRSEWTDKAPSLIVQFFMPRDAKVASENIDRLLDAQRDFARRHFVLHDEYPAGSSLGYLITSKMADLFELKGERVAGVERVLAELEATAPDPASVRYLRASFYMQRVEGQQKAAREAMLRKARETLKSLAADGAGLYNRKALATLASLEFGEGAFSEAREAFRKYSASYPQSNWAWVALLRAGQCEEVLGNPKAAVAAYLEAATKYAERPLARVLGQEYAARAYEAAGEFESAVGAHQRALDGWDNAFGLRYSTFFRQPQQRDDPFVPAVDRAEVTKESLSARIVQLKRSLSRPGGVSIERGRWLLGRGRYEEAMAEVERMLVEHSRSPAASEARELRHRAHFERALELGDVERADADEAAASKELEALAREPHDFAVTAAKIARASLLWKQGEAAGAEKLMSDALTEWHAHQRSSRPPAGLEEDVAEIRRVIFLPEGGGIYASGRWNAFSWPAQPPPFCVVNADVQLKLHNGEAARVTLVQELPAAGKVVFFDTQQIALLHKTLVKLGGMRRREPRQIMETPNQPVGDSMQILRLWNKFFHARPGHWGGWEVETYPVVTEIHFTNAERTKAAARVTIGYSGATVELEKEAGKWIARRLTSQWIT